MPKFALFVDLENCGAKAATLRNIIEKVKIRGDILIGKVYGYTDRFSDLKEILLSNTFSVVPSLRYGHSQKNNLDIQLVIDALEVAYTNTLIDSFCIVSGDSDYTPLVGKLKTMGKVVLGISRSAVASEVFINACTEFVFLESVATTPPRMKPAEDNGNGLEDVAKLIETVLSEQADDEGYLHASELKSVLLRLKPDFHEKNYGCSSFGKLLVTLETKFKTIHLEQDNFALKIRLRSTPVDIKLTKENWMEIVLEHLSHFKEDGFDRINPSILKAALQSRYPTFDERQIGFKRFSDMMRRLEKEKRIQIEVDDSGTMLLRIL